MSWNSDTLGRDRRSAGCQALNSKRLKLGAKAYGSRRAIVQTTWQDVAGMFKSFNTTICCRHVAITYGATCADEIRILEPFQALVHQRRSRLRSQQLALSAAPTVACSIGALAHSIRRDAKEEKRPQKDKTK